jgi:CCDC81 eukaryotic HU domain 1
MRIIWNSLGLYISRNLRMGRGVNIPKLGIFTFTPPEVRLKVTSIQIRELQIKQRGINSREPLFFSSKKTLLRA